MIGGLTIEEEKMLWRGRYLYKREIEKPEKSGKSKPGQRATSADYREFEKFAAETNSE